VLAALPLYSPVLASSLGIQNAAMQTALQAGVQSLINKSAIALINNQSDLGAALKELGSSASIRGLLTSMVAAGLTAQLSDMAGIGQSLPRTAPLADRIVREMQRNLIKATINASVGTAIQGGKFADNLTDATRLAAAIWYSRVRAPPARGHRTHPCRV
jgi:filamentous hemagglutinin